MSVSSRILVDGGDTIAALATAQGRSATALVRVSGSRAFEIVRTITRAPLPPPRTATLRALYSTAGDERPFDRCVITVFEGPHSYTGEDTAELSVHGGFMVPTLALETLVRSGAREAFPGEFTRRALLNGKLDLLQAEAVSDLIDSRSRGAVAAAISQLDGGLTKRVTELRSAILEVEALVAYDIDFPEEDDGPIDRGRILAACRDVIERLAGLLATAGMGEMLREGALIVIAGAPNAGKSSLFNALAGSRRSLVTEVAGTTRDAIEAVIDAGAWTLRLVDTAGLRDTTEMVERLGIEVAEEYLSRAQVVLACGDSDASLLATLTRTGLLSGSPTIAVLTKSDMGERHRRPMEDLVAECYQLFGARVAGVCEVSVITGGGLAELLRMVGTVLAGSHTTQQAGAPMLLRARHQRAVAEASREMSDFVRVFSEDEVPVSVAAIHLRAAAGALESLIGTVGIEDVLDRLFSTFCVGK